MFLGRLKIMCINGNTVLLVYQIKFVDHVIQILVATLK